MSEVVLAPSPFVQGVQLLQQVSLVSWAFLAPSVRGAQQVRLIVRHQESGREYAFFRDQMPGEEMTLVSDYPILPGLTGVRAAFNHLGQAYWLKFSAQEGWHVARYMFPDEQEAWMAARLIRLPVELSLNEDGRRALSMAP